MALAQSIPSLSRMFDNEKTYTATPSVIFSSSVVSSYTLRVIDSGATNADLAQEIHAVDLDGDGDMDVVTAAAASSQFAWYENDGLTPPGWTLHVIDSGATGAWDIEAADVDGDGDTDVVTAAWTADQFAWYESDGLTPPVWTLHVIDSNVANTDGARDIDAVDLDGDGDMDVVTAADASNQFAWYENDGSTPPVWTLRVIDSGATNADLAQEVHAVDLDGDGDMDVVTAAAASNQFAWYENDGLTPPVWTLHVIDNTVANAEYAYAIDAVDLDGDGDTDVVTAAYFADQFAWYESDGATPPVWTLRVIDSGITNADGAFDIDAVDFDGDGDTDVVTAAAFADQFAWYENDGATPPVWTLRVIDSTTNANGARDVDAVDFDGDGDTDVVTAAFSSNQFAWYETGGAEVLQYEVQWDTVRGFIDADPAIGSRRSWEDSGFTNLDDGADVDPFRAETPSGSPSRPERSPTATTYWWRVRSRRSDTLALSAWSTPRTFTVDTAQTDYSQWHQTTSQQFVNDTLADAVTGLESPTLHVIDSGATNADGARELDAVDLDGDGDTDVVTAACAANQFAWYENDGATPPGWTLHVIDTTSKPTAPTTSTRWTSTATATPTWSTAAGSSDQFAWYENDGAIPLAGRSTSSTAHHQRRRRPGHRCGGPRRRRRHRRGDRGLQLRSVRLVRERRVEPPWLDAARHRHRPHQRRRRPGHRGGGPRRRRRHRRGDRGFLLRSVRLVRERRIDPPRLDTARHRQRRPTPTAPSTSTRWTSTATATPTW